MNDSLNSFTYRDSINICTIIFYPDRMEYRADYLGMNVEVRQRSFPASDLAWQMSEQRGGRRLRLAYILYILNFVFLSVLSFSILPGRWKIASFAFDLTFLIAACVLADYVRIRRWFVVRRKDRALALYIPISGWPLEEIKRFRASYRELVAPEDPIKRNLPNDPRYPTP